VKPRGARLARSSPGHVRLHLRLRRDHLILTDATWTSQLCNIHLTSCTTGLKTPLQLDSIGTLGLTQRCSIGRPSSSGSPPPIATARGKSSSFAATRPLNLRRLKLTACLPILLFSHRSELHGALATHLPQVPEQVLGPALGTLAAAACILLSVSFRRPQSFRLAGPDARGISSQLLVRHPDPPPLRLQLL
jgi:hypothetical protein